MASAAYEARYGSKSDRQPKPSKAVTPKHGYWDLHDYQIEALDFATEKKKCALFLKMGAGKTVIALTWARNMLRRGEANHILVLAPLRVANSVWEPEIEKWSHLNHLDHINACGSVPDRTLAISARKSITVINHDKVKWLYQNHMWIWDAVIVDESSAYKSHRTKRFKMLSMMSAQCNAILLLSGTPAPNSYMDLWSQMFLLDRGKALEPTWNRFVNKYFTITFNGSYNVYEVTPEGEKIIKARIKPLAMTIPESKFGNLESIDIDIKVEMPDNAKKAYKEIAQDYITSLQEGEQQLSVESASALSMKLRQIANGAAYNEVRDVIHVHDAKLKALQEIVDEYPSENMIVATAFKHDQTRILEKFKQARLLKTNEEIEQWNAGEIPMLILHPASGGHGLNLQFGGSMIVWFGLPWNLEHWLQTNAWLLRQGQKETVRIVRLIASSSIDVQIVRALKSKSDVLEDFMKYLERYAGL